MMKHIKVRVTLGEKNFFTAKANHYELKLNDYARSLLIGVDRNRFIKPKSRIKFDTLIAMSKGTVRDLRNLGHNVDEYLPILNNLESAAWRESQFKKKPLQLIVDESPAMLHLHFSTEEIAQIARQSLLNNQSRNDYIRGTLRHRDLPNYKFGEVPLELWQSLWSIWLELGDFKTSVVCQTSYI
ncbi:hypothetical protein [Merismopedia glauca]|uniref:Uncharacterized protein n=1 Tax=Merismopedia glauca CCAP 1448/3 TaxID=1296344 RepID=A0A2T1C279_9CYAN|nr:hypothetical protein [Merismopedia glauca]PSB02371.1 hypothetical protein C7B64_13375 [Merismopedia glauca CCAP 1448/3]